MRRFPVARRPLVSHPERMSDTALVVLILVPLLLAFAYGVWVGLGYPGIYDKYEKTGRTPRKTPFQMMVDWLVERWDRRG